MMGKTEKEIREVREKAAKYLKSKGYEVVDTYFPIDDWFREYKNKRGVIHESVWFLALSIKYMSFCDTVFFCKGWENARGCRIEHEIAQAYGLNIIYEE